MRKWGTFLWVVFITLICLFLGAFGYVVYLWINVDRAWLLFTFFGFEVLLFLGVTIALRKSHFLHMHHYTIAMCLIPFVSLQDGFLTFIGAYCNGVMIEGGSRWGYDPIWIRKKITAPTTAATKEPSAAV